MVTEEVQKSRMEYWRKLEEVKAEQLVFIDESGFWVEMARQVARAEKGKKVYEKKKRYRGKKVTTIGAIRTSEVVATKTLKGSMKKADFLEFIETDLLPQLKPGDVVIMDNLNSHRCQEVRTYIESKGARVEYLPVYSPEFNPIEMMWSQIKSIVRKFKTTTIEALTRLIKVASSLVDSQSLVNWFTKCCYCTQ